MADAPIVETAYNLAAVVDPGGAGINGPRDVDGGEGVTRIRKCRLHAAENDRRERCQRDNPRVLHSPPSLGEHKRDETGGWVCGFANRGPRRTSYKWSAVIFNRAVPATPTTPQYAAWIVVLYQPGARNQNTNFTCAHMLRMPLSVKSRFRKRDAGEPNTLFSET